MRAEVVHENPWYGVTRQERPDGTWFRVVHADCAMLVARDDAGRLLMVRGIRDTVPDGAFLEFPCGGIDHGESAEDAAVREGREEAGVVVTDVRAAGVFTAVPGMSAMRCHVFTARVVTLGAQALGAGESWTPEFRTPAALRTAVRDGEVRDGGTLAAIALLEAGR